MALWEVMQPPFRMLDEFDVFMDMMNRNKSVEMMLEFCKKKRKYQYFFITPLDTSMVEDDADVSIVRIKKNTG